MSSKIDQRDLEKRVNSFKEWLKGSDFKYHHSIIAQKILKLEAKEGINDEIKKLLKKPYRNPSYNKGRSNIFIQDQNELIKKFELYFSQAYTNYHNVDIDIRSSRDLQIDSYLEYDTLMDTKKITQYVESDQGFKIEDNGFVILPNEKKIPNLRTINALTRFFCAKKSLISYDKNYFYNTYTEEEPREQITINNLHEITEKHGGSLTKRKYTAILKGKEQIYDLLIKDNFPNEWSQLEKYTGLVYAAPQLAGLNHINFKKNEMLELHECRRGISNDRDEETLGSLLRICNM